MFQNWKTFWNRPARGACLAAVFDFDQISGAPNQFYPYDSFVIPIIEADFLKVMVSPELGRKRHD